MYIVFRHFYAYFLGGKGMENYKTKKNVSSLLCI